MFGLIDSINERAEPFDIGLNAAVMTLAHIACPRGWDVLDFVAAPHDLHTATRYVREVGKVAVWDGESDRTVFACPEHNYAFRAWHDALHVKHQLDFNVSGEAAVAYLQIQQLVKLYGLDEEVHRWCAVVFTEVIGQALYHARKGYFPEDQRRFTVSNLQQWMGIAGRIAAEVGDLTERQVIALARKTWG